MRYKNIFVLYSTVESVKNGKISIVAILETLAMTSIGFWLFITFGWWWHILIGLLISPMFYLRTKESTLKSIEYTNKAYAAITSGKYISKSSMLFIISIRIILLFVSFSLVYKILEIIKIDDTIIFSLLISLSGLITITLITSKSIDFYKLKKGLNLLEQEKYDEYKNLSLNLDEEDLIMSDSSYYFYNHGHSGDYDEIGFKYHHCHRQKNKNKCFSRIKKIISNEAKYLAVDGLVSAVLVGVFITSIMIMLTAFFKFSLIGLLLIIFMLVPISVILTSIGLSIYLALLFLIVRTLVGVYFLIISTRLSILAIPNNWSSMIFSQDSMHPPELVPNSEASDFSNVTYRALVGYFLKSSHLLEKIIISVFLVILYIPAWIFRYTMKMGAWLWLPLIWVTQKPSKGKRDDAVFLQGESTEFWANFRLLYSLIILSIFTFLPLVLATEFKLHNLQEHALGVIFLFGFTKFWTWVRAIVALLAIVSYLFTRHIRLHRDNGNQEYGIFWVQKLIQLVYLRMILSMFTLGISLYLVATEIIDWDLVLSSFSMMQYLP